MDKNSITGVVLIVAIVFGYNYLFPPVIEVAQEAQTETVVIEEQSITNLEKENIKSKTKYNII